MTIWQVHHGPLFIGHFPVSCRIPGPNHKSQHRLPNKNFQHDRDNSEQDKRYIWPWFTSSLTFKIMRYLYNNSLSLILLFSVVTDNTKKKYFFSKILSLEEAEIQATKKLKYIIFFLNVVVSNLCQFGGLFTSPISLCSSTHMNVICPSSIFAGIKIGKISFFCSRFVWCEDTWKITDCPWEYRPSKLAHSSVLV